MGRKSPWDRQREAWKVRNRYKPAQHGRAELRLYQADALTALRGAFRGEAINEGDTTMQLLVGGALWMSDTPDEYRDHVAAILKARGKVLIHGLGLGCYLSAILTKPEVSSVDVVERDGDVIALVGPYFAGDSRVTIYHDDCFLKRWPKGSRWDVVWHDVWESKCTDDLAAHSKLLCAFGRRATWQGAWAHDYLTWRRAQERRAGW